MFFGNTIVMHDSEDFISDDDSSTSNSKSEFMYTKALKNYCSEIY